MAKMKAKRLLSLLLSLAMLVSLAVTPVYAADVEDSSEPTASEADEATPAEETSEDSAEEAEEKEAETEEEAAEEEAEADEEETAEESANLTATSDSGETFTVYYGTTHKYTVEYDEDKTYDLTQPYSDEVGYGVSNERLYAGLYTDRTYKTPLDTDNAEVGNGLESYPEAGETYYVKEISYHYLEIKCLYAWNEYNKLVNLWPVTGIDSNNYSAIGFIIDDGDSNYTNDTIDVEESPLTDESTLAGDTQIYETLNVTYPGGDPENVYTDCTNLFGVAGYLAVTQALDETLSNYSGGDEITMQAYYVTLDGIMVTGAVERTLTFKEDLSGFTYVDESVESETSDGVEDTGTITMVLSLAVSDECVLTASVPEETTYTITKCDDGTVSTQEVAEGEDVEITYTEKDGYLFGGWFMDESYTEAADFSNITGDMTVYAKYVSADYMQVKVAIQSKKNVVTALRFFSAVDSKNYAEVGFEYEYDGTKETVEVTKYSTTVSGYTAVKLFAGDVVTGSKLIYNDFSVSKISAGTEITVAPYWVTQDGTMVYGTARTVTFTGMTVQ